LKQKNCLYLIQSKRIFIKTTFALYILVSVSILGQSPESFFPSEVGNLWEYQGNISGLDWRIIGDSIASNGNRFLFTIGKPFLYRLDTLFNVYERYSNGAEDHAYDLEADSGDVWIYGPYYAWVAGIDSVLVFGEATIMKIIRVGPEYPDSNWSNFYYQEQYLASGFGIIYHWEEPGNVAFLRGCIVGGDTFGTVTSVHSSILNIPNEFILNQNYPNPFNPTTTIQFELPVPAKVQLTVYDLLGRRVRKLVNAEQTIGNYAVEFDARDLSSGVYVYQLVVADKAVLSRKMILLK